MESNYSNREFEQYIKSTADQYRMIPTDKVWKGINSTLHTRRRWYGIGLASLLLLTAVSVTWIMLTYPASKKQETTANQNPKTVTRVQPTDKSQGTTATVKDMGSILSLNKFSPARQPIEIATIAQREELPFNIETDLATTQIPVTRLSVPLSMVKQGDLSVYDDDFLKEPVAGITTHSDPLDFSASDEEVKYQTPLYSETKSVKSPLISSPLTIESVLGSYRAKKLIKKLTWQVYFAPTVSYRKLSVNKSYEGNVSPFSANNYPFAFSKDVNSEVTHKPDMGVELGVSTRYPVTKKIKLTGALQFNINRYDIKAFAYYGEEATINLNGGNGTNSVRAWTYYRNYDGYKSDWLKNYYFSVSAPVGAEFRLIGNNKTYFGVAGNVQPTYILKDRAFLISSDYKNYVEVPRLIRHWNINTSFETFVSYTSRSSNTRWQIGPQVRYQVLSSFKNKYPVNENLFDFGLKVGISRNK